MPSDVDLTGGVVTIREKKRDKTKLTTRRVPLTPLLKAVLADWMTRRGKGKALFCKPDGHGITQRMAHRAAFLRCLRPSKWRVLKRLARFPPLVHLRPGQQGRGPAHH